MHERMIRLKKSMLLLSLLAAGIMMVSGCSMIELNEERDAQVVLAQVGVQQITKGEFEKLWNQQRTQYGITDEIESDSQYTETIQYLKESLLEGMVDDEVSIQQARSRGYFEFSEEQKAEMDEEFNSTLASLRESVASGLELDSLSQEDQDALIDQETEKYRQENGYTDEYIREMQENSEAVSALYDDITKDVTVSESELTTEYNDLVTDDQETYADDADAYVQAVLSYGYDVYYIPAGGMRLIRQILIALPDDVQEQISDLRDNEDDEGADAVRETALEAIRGKAEEALQKLSDGTAFDDVLEEYNEDPGMESHPEGYPVNSSVTTYAAEFTEGAMALKKEGDLSGLVASDFGYHILLYADTLAEGPVDFETVKEQVRETVLNTNKQTLWSSTLEEWKSAMTIKTYPKRID